MNISDSTPMLSGNAPSEAPRRTIPQDAARLPDNTPMYNTDGYMDAYGNVDSFASKELTGDTGQRIGYVPARDEGAFKEHLKGYRLGWERLKRGYGSTFGNEDMVAAADNFMQTNKNLDDSERKGTLSFIANFLGSQTIENAPTFAAMIAAGSVTGGTGAVAVGASRAAVFAAGFASTFARTYGENREEIDLRMPDVSTSYREFAALGITLFQSGVEMSMGFGGAARNAIAARGMAQALAKGGRAAALKSVLQPRLLGRLGKFKKTFPGQVLNTGFQEAGEEVIQNAGMDITVRALSGQPDPRTGKEIWDQYVKSAVLGFVGGVWLGGIPATMNALTYAQRKSKENELKSDNPSSVAIVDGVNTMVNAEAPLITKQFFNGVTRMFGPTAGKVFRNISYNLAATQMELNRREGRADAVLPEDYLKDVTLLIQNDAGRTAQLQQSFVDDPTGAAAISLINSWSPETEAKITSLHDMWEEQRLRRETDGLAKELPFDVRKKNVTLNDVAKASVSTILGGAEAGSALYNAAARITQIAGGTSARSVDPVHMGMIIEKMGGVAAEIYARGGWIRGIEVKVGEVTKKLAMRMDMVKGVMAGTFFDDAVAEGMLAEEAKEAGGKPTRVAGVVSKTAKGFTAMPSLDVSSESLAQARREQLSVGEAKIRLQEFGDMKNGVAPVSEAEVTGVADRTAAEHAANVARAEAGALETLRRMREKVSMLRAEIANGKVEAADPELGKRRIQEFLDRYQKIQPDVNKAPTAEEQSAVSAEGMSKTLAEQVTALEAELRKGITEDAALNYFDQLVPKGMIPEPSETAPVAKREGGSGFYMPDYKLVALLQGHNAQTAIHEIFHHLIENALMPPNVHALFVKNFGVGDGDNRRLDNAGKENAANALLFYIRDGVLPTDPEIASALQAIKRVCQNSKILSYAVQDEAGKVSLDPTRTMKDKAGKSLLPAEVQDMLAKLVAPIDNNTISKIYGQALDSSLKMAEEDRILNTPRMESDLNILSRKSRLTRDNIIQQIFAEMPEFFGDDPNLTTLTDQQKVVLQERLAQQVRDLEPIAGGVKPVALWEPRLAQGDLFPDEGLPPEFPETEVGFGGEYVPKPKKTYAEWQAIIAERNRQLELNLLPAKLDEPSAETVPLQEDKTDAEYHAALIKRLHTRAVFGEMDQAEMHNIAHARAVADYGVNSITEMTNEQLIEMLYSIQAEQSPTKGARQDTGEAKELGGSLPSGLYNDLNIKVDDSFLTKAGKVLTKGGNRFRNRVSNFTSAVNILAENNPDSPWVKLMAIPWSVMQNNTYRETKAVLTEFYELMEKNAPAWKQQYATVQVGDRMVARSSVAFYYVLTDYGKDMDSDFIKNIQSAPNGPTDAMLRDSVKIAEADPQMLEFIRVTQEISNKLYSDNIPIRERVSGEIMKPLNRAYVRVEHMNQKLSPQDILAPTESFTYTDSRGQTLTPVPAEFHHRTGGGGDQVNSDYYGMVLKHVASMVNYKNKADTVARILDSLASDSVVNGFKTKMGDTSFLETLQDLAKRELSQSGKLHNFSGPLDNSIKFVTGNAAPAFLSWNFMTPLVQMVSVPLFLATIPMKYSGKMMLNIADAVASASMKRGIRNTELYKWVERESPFILEIYKTRALESIDEVLNAKGVKGFYMGKTGFNKFLDWGMRPLQETDMTTRLAAYKTAYEIKMEQLGGTGMNEDEMKVAARQFAEDMLGKSFNPASKFERSLLQSEASEGTKSLMLFSSQPFAQMRWFVNDMYLPTLRAWQKSGVAGLAKHLMKPQTAYKLALGCMLPGLMMGAIGRRRRQATLEEVLFDSFVLGLGNMIPVIGHALWFNSAFGFTSGAGDYAGVHGRFAAEVATVISDLIKREPDFKTVKSAIATVELLTRFPDFPARVTLAMYKRWHIKGGSLDGQPLFTVITGAQKPVKAE